MTWFVRGDIYGFFGLDIDNLIQLLHIAGFCDGLLGFPPDSLFGKVMPSVAVSLIVGNLFYAWQAKRLATRTGRTEVCPLPYGIRTTFDIVMLTHLGRLRFKGGLPGGLVAVAVGTALS